MGNAIAKKYDASKDYTATTGHCKLFKCYSAKSKENLQDVSIWVFDKTELGKAKYNAITDKSIQEQIYQIMKKDMNLLKEISSSQTSGSNILHYIEAIEERFENISLSLELEDIKKFYFGNVNNGNLQYGITGLEISRGLLNIAEGLQYLHTVQRKLHLNLSPESICITASGHWKLCSLGLSLGFQHGEHTKLPSPYFLKSLNSGNIIRLEPDLKYSGPELTEGCNDTSPSIRYLTRAADVFSLGIIAYEAYRCFLDSSSEKRFSLPHAIPISNNDSSFHLQGLANISRLNYSFFPSHELVTLLQSMIALDPLRRLTTPDIINNPYFATGSMAVLRSIDTLKSRDIGTQSSILMMLPNQLISFPLRLLEGTILPTICSATKENLSLMTFALPTHIFIARQISKAKYSEVARDVIILALENSSHVDVMQGLLRHIEFFMESFDNTIESSIVSLLANTLDKSQLPIHILGFRCLCDEKVRNYISPSNLVAKIIPKICREACKNGDPNIKIHALYVLSLLVNKLDKPYIIQNILPSLKYIIDHEKNPIVSMCVLGNYNALAEKLGPEFLANIILPSIVPLLMDRTLDKRQYELVGYVVKSLLCKINDIRSGELGIQATSTQMFEKTQIPADLDPFYAAKLIIQETKKKQDKEYHESMPEIVQQTSKDVTYKTFETIPLPPSTLPPPPPTMLPPPPPMAPITSSFDNSNNPVSIQSTTSQSSSFTSSSFPINSNFPSNSSYGSNTASVSSGFADLQLLEQVKSSSASSSMTATSQQPNFNGMYSSTASHSGFGYMPPQTNQFQQFNIQQYPSNLPTNNNMSSMYMPPAIAPGSVPSLPGFHQTNSTKSQEKKDAFSEFDFLS